MTKQECAIIALATGTVTLVGDDLKYLYDYAERLMGYPLHTHELLVFADELKERAMPDFKKICSEASDVPDENVGKFPVGGVDRSGKCDRISIQNAVETPFWMAVWAAEPTREIDVHMTYSDLKVLLDAFDNVRKFVKGGKNEQSEEAY